MKKVLYYCFSLTACFFLSLLILELTLQATQGRSRINISSKKYGLEHRKSTTQIAPHPDDSEKTIELRTNNLGFREDEDTELISPPGVLRVLILGDSHTDGYVENGKSFPNLLEQHIARDRAVTAAAEVINAGLGGSSIVTQYMLLKDEYLELKPSRIIMAVYLGNDFEELLIENKPRFVPKGADYVYAGPDQGEKLDFYLILYQIRKTLILPSLIWSAFVKCDVCFDAVGRFLPEELFTILLANKVNAPGFSQSFTQSYYFNQNPERISEALKIYEHTLDLVIALTTEKNIDLSFILIPSKLQIEPETDLERIGEIRKVLSIDEDIEDYFYDEIKKIFLARDLPFVDFLAIFTREKQNDRRNYYYTDLDYHLNQVGNEIIANHLLQVFRGQNTYGWRDGSAE